VSTYCFFCPSCDFVTTSNVHGLVPACSHGPMKRDYRAENTAVQTLQLKRERETGGSSAVRDLFLPSAKDYAGPSDPDGSKGIRQWNDEHVPGNGNKRPLRPESPRKVW